MHALASKRLSRISILIISALIISGCGEGDGPKSVAGTAATPLPVIPPGFCDAINFETLCEQPTVENFNGGVTTTIDNPDSSGINVSEKVGKMQKFSEEVFGGTKLVLIDPVDFSAGEFYKVKVWAQRAVPVSFKLEETGNPGGGRTLAVNHSGNGTWEELCYDFTGLTAGIPNPPVLALTIIFDLGVLGQAQAGVDDPNWTFYYDDIEQVSSCAGGGGGGGTSIDPDSALYSTAGAADLVIPDDYAEVTAFGSGSVIDAFYADDSTYNPVLSVFSGTGYGANIAQVGYTGFLAGFAGAYETLNFKVKGMPNQVIFVNLFDGLDSLRLNLTSSTYSDALGDGWFQVSIPIAAFTGVDQATGIVFESDNTAPMQFTMLLTDIGFSGTGTGGPMPADPGIIPEDVIYATDPGEVIDLVATITAFGTSSMFDGAYALDADFSPSFQAMSGSGYGLDNIVQLGFIGLAPGFASGYESFSFKIKSSDLPNNTIIVKLEGGGAYGDVVLTDTTVSTDLGNGWYQVVLPMSGFANVDPAVGVLFEAVGPQNADGGAPFSFLATDIGFTNPAGGGGADPGIIPEDVIYATDPGEAVDLVATITAFGTTSMFDGAYALDADFNPSFQAVSGSGYGLDNIVQLGFVGLPAGFASGYESFSFKIKSSDLPNNTIIVKLEAGGAYGDVLLTDTTVSTDLGNGWYQVVLPMSGFGNVDPAVGILFEAVGPQNADGGAPFSFVATDIGFNNPAGGGGGTGVIPEDVIYATDPAEVIDLVATITAFGTTSMFDGAYALDADFNPSFQAMSGSGYGLDNIVQLGFVDLAPGFASGYESFSFKIKSSDLPNNTIIVKLEQGGAYGDVVLTDTTVSTDLGNGWYQVVLPMSGFGNVDPAVGVLFEAVGPQNADGGAPFSFLATDIGFSGTAGGGGGNGSFVNGDFETGDFTGWTQTPDGGSIAIDNSGQGGRAGFVARLIATGSAAGAQDVLLSQVDLMDINSVPISGGDSVTVSVDVFGTLAGAGGVVFIELISRDSGGNETGRSFIGPAPIFPTTTWTTESSTVDVAADVSGGITLQLKSSCGPVPGCVVDASFDNVTMTINGGGGGGGGGGDPAAAVTPEIVLFATDPAEMVDLVAGTDYTGLEAFGSGAIFDLFHANDPVYSPVVAVTSGTGYGANIGQFAYVGFAAGFATGYESLNFKVKDMPGDLIRVKFLDAGDYLDVDLTDPMYSTLLGDGWYQVTIPIADFTGVATATGLLFETNNTAPMQFTFLLTDIGFSGTAGGGGGGTGIIPEDVIYATDPGEMVDLVATITAFGTTSMFDGAYALDADFNPAFLAQSGNGYGLDNIVQLGFVGLPAGFASGYESFSFKIKSSDLPNNTIIVKLEQGGAYGDVVLTDTSVSTDLGNGWYQVVLPMSGFANVAPAVGILFEAVGPQNADGGAPFSFLATDIGFTNPTGGGGGGTSVIPEDVIYATDPAEVIDLVATITAFGTTSMFDGAYALDADFNPSFQAASGSGYGLDNIVQLGFIGFAPGFASTYESFSFKIKSADLPNNTIIVKLEQGGAYGDVLLTDTSVSTDLGNGWYQVVLPMSGFGNVDPAVGVLFEAVGPQNADGGAPFSFLATDIGFSGTGGGGSGTCPPVGAELATNGNFEAGDLSCWETITNGGTITADNTENNTAGGTWSAHAVTAGASNPTLKQNFLAEGTVQIGDVIDISFDMKGTAGAGGVIFPKLISEGAAGSDGPILETIAVPNANWQTYSYSPTITADVTRGITFEISVVCGAVAGCTADVFIDNVTIQIR